MSRCRVSEFVGGGNFLPRKTMAKAETVSEQQARNDAVMRKHANALYDVDVHTPLDELLAREAEEGGVLSSEEVQEVRAEAFIATMDFIYADGPEPLMLVRRILVLAKAIKPELLGGMSMEDMAILSDDSGRATVSARLERVYTRFLKNNGARVTKSRSQKKKTSKYREAAVGNTNRKGTGKSGRRSR